MHPSEIDDVMRTFTVLIDSREQQTERSKLRYKQFGCPYKREKLDFGDYGAVLYLPDGKQFRVPVKIERKMNLTEICGNFTHERDRFIREFERAKASGEKIILLIEGATWEMAYSGKYRSQMAPQSLIASMTAWLARYDCQIIMCRAETSGRLIRDILYREAKEALTRMTEDDSDG